MDMCFFNPNGLTAKTNWKNNKNKFKCISVNIYFVYLIVGNLAPQLSMT